MTFPRRSGQGTVIRGALILVVVAGCLLVATPSADAGYRETVVGTPGLVGYWRLGEASGTTATDELRIQSGAYRGAVTLRQPGAIAGDANTSAYFNAPSQFV